MSFEIKPAPKDDTALNNAANAFAARFQAPPDYLIRVPGRVNIIGERESQNENMSRSNFDTILICRH